MTNDDVRLIPVSGEQVKRLLRIETDHHARTGEGLPLLTAIAIDYENGITAEEVYDATAFPYHIDESNSKASHRLRRLVGDDPR